MKPKKPRRKRRGREFQKDAAPEIRMLEQTLNELADANRRLEHAAAMLVTPPGEPEQAPAKEASEDTEAPPDDTGAPPAKE